MDIELDIALDRTSIALDIAMEQPEIALDVQMNTSVTVTGIVFSGIRDNGPPYVNSLVDV